ncbi:MAG: PD40 domain-containing protein [Anaerolineales bacterium]|nr:PD40 domain-containing protein [Anaerolineales bacterium]
MSNNLIPDDSNESSDVFIHDRLTKQTELISKDNDGDQGNSDSYGGSISADGRFVVFYSWSSNLVPEDEKGFSNVFVNDRQTEQTELISITSEGKPGNSDSEASGGSISGNGRYVAFKSFANNLVGGDTNGFSDIFVRDRELGDTVRVSVSTNGEQGNGENGWFNSVSSNGRYVVYSSSSSTLVDEDNNELEDIFVHDLQSGKTERVTMGSDGTEPNGYSYAPFISADGKYITYTSLADNLVMGDENEYRDVFINEWIGVMEIFIPIVTK